MFSRWRLDVSRWRLGGQLWRLDGHRWVYARLDGQLMEGWMFSRLRLDGQ